MTSVETLPLALPETMSGATAQLLLPPRRRGARAMPAVVICPGLTNDPSPADWIGQGLASRGIAVTLPAVAEPVDERRSGEPPEDRLGGILEVILATIAQLRRTTTIDPARVGVLGIGSGAALACRAAARDEVDRIALVGPVAPELIVRRLDRVAERVAERGREHPAGGASGNGHAPSRRGPAPPAPNESTEATLMRRLAALQPLRALAEAKAKPTMILHAATDEHDGPEHARAIAMALVLDGRPVERLAVAFVDASFQAEGDAPMQQAVLAPLGVFFGPK